MPGEATDESSGSRISSTVTSSWSTSDLSRADSGYGSILNGGSILGGSSNFQLTPTDVFDTRCGSRQNSTTYSIVSDDEIDLSFHGNCSYTPDQFHDTMFPTFEQELVLQELVQKTESTEDFSFRPFDPLALSDTMNGRDFHTLKMGEHSPSYLVGTGAVEIKRTTSPPTHCKGSQLFDESNLPLSKKSSDVGSDAEKCSDREISEESDCDDSLLLWNDELEVFIDWACTCIMPGLLTDFQAQKPSSFLSGSSFRFHATQESSQDSRQGGVSNGTGRSSGERK